MFKQFPWMRKRFKHLDMLVFVKHIFFIFTILSSKLIFQVANVYKLSKTRYYETFHMVWSKCLCKIKSWSMISWIVTILTLWMVLLYELGENICSKMLTMCYLFYLQALQVPLVFNFFLISKKKCVKLLNWAIYWKSLVFPHITNTYSHSYIWMSNANSGYKLVTVV